MTTKYAPSWKRLVSYIVDILITYTVAFIIGIAFGLPKVIVDWLSFGLFFYTGH
jgi:hypothetical protein